MNIFIISAIGLVCLLVIVLVWIKKQASNINQYFCNAALVWLFRDDEDAKIAAIAASKLATEKQRESLLNYLSGMALDFEQNFPDDPTKKKHRRMLLKLKGEISAKDWTMEDVVEEKNRLAMVNQDYLQALNKADANVFVRKYPDFFKQG